MHRYLASVASVLALSLLASGCGGHSPAVATVGSSASTARAGALAFARCMRAHGLPRFPDPTSEGSFDKATLLRLNYSVAQIRAVQDGPCNRLLQAMAPPGPQITAADRADYLRAAACMRTHGFPGFPDPSFKNNGVQTNIPPTVDQHVPAFNHAATLCTKLIPAGLPYSGAGTH